MDRPKVVVYQVAALDGRLTLAPGYLLLDPGPRWQAVAGTSDISDVAHRWLASTHEPGATLEGSGSLVRDGDVPGPLPPFEGDLEALYRDHLPGALIERMGHRRWFVVVDGRGRVRWLYKETEDDHLLVLACRHTPPEYLAYLQREDIPYLVAGQERVDLALALAGLKSRLGVACVLSTAGGRLNGALLRAGLVDEINVAFYPAVIGGRGTPALFDAPPLGADEWPVPLRLISSHVQADGGVWLRYEVVREGS